MRNDLISRSALKEKIHDFVYGYRTPKISKGDLEHGLNKFFVDKAPAVDAMVLPKGRPGDYLEWETGITGHTTIQPIKAILICEDCVRYDLGVFAPTVNHENIVRIMSREEANREIERRAKNGK